MSRRTYTLTIEATHPDDWTVHDLADVLRWALDVLPCDRETTLTAADLVDASALRLHSTHLTEQAPS